MLDIVVKVMDLSILQNVFQFYESIISSCGGYTIVPNAVTYCAAKFYVSVFTEGLAWELKAAHAKNAGKGISSCRNQNRVWESRK